LLYFFLIPIAEIIICIPVIKSVIETLRVNELSPKLGTVIAKVDIAMFRIPTPKRMLLDQLEISLSLRPCIILLIPLNSKANAPRAIGDAGWDNGINMSTMAMAIINGPSPVLTSLYDLPGNGNAIPVAILSIPNMRRTIESIRMITFVVIPGYIRVPIVKIMANAPKLTSINRNQLGDFLLLILSSLFEFTLVKYGLPGNSDISHYIILLYIL
jgi:hypothetical protein